MKRSEVFTKKQNLKGKKNIPLVIFGCLIATVFLEEKKVGKRVLETLGHPHMIDPE